MSVPRILLVVVFIAACASGALFEHHQNGGFEEDYGPSHGIEIGGPNDSQSDIDVGQQKDEEEQFRPKYHRPICHECGQTYDEYRGQVLHPRNREPLKICHKAECYNAALVTLAEERGYRYY